MVTVIALLLFYSNPVQAKFSDIATSCQNLFFSIQPTSLWSRLVHFTIPC